MDFGTLLQTAKQNDGVKKEVRAYSTKFAPPKKEDKKDKLLSANIQKFLARKENEEKKKTQEALKRRDELLVLRSKDKKATRRVNVMLKRTKSANQSVIDDAVDYDNTAVTLAGPAQPDEDDYGYVSQEASAFYNKMMEKYNKMPEEEKFPNAKKKASSNLSNTKDRVKAALEKEQLEAMLPHRRKRKHKEGEEHDDHQDNDEPESKSEPPSKVKPKNKGPPPMNFSELLKLASQKQHEPIMIEVKPKDEGPLFTKKQKQELEKEQHRRLGDVKGRLSAEQINEIRKLPPSHLYKTKKRRDGCEISRSEIHENSGDSDDYEKPKSINRIPKINNEASINKEDVREKPSSHIPKKSIGVSSEAHISKSSNGVRPSKSSNERIVDTKVQNPNRLSKIENERHSSKPLGSKISNENRLSKAPQKVPMNNIREKSNNIIKANDSLSLKQKTQVGSSSSQKIENNKFKAPTTSNNNLPKKNDINKLNTLNKQKQVQPNDRQPKPTPSKQFPPADVRRKQPPPPAVRKNNVPTKPIANKRRIIDDEDEYDSEMDDFIDDGPEESNDYSTYIREIFGYDKRKYRVIDDDDDDDNMESSFAQQMREDVRSAKLGLLEDLEDIKREKEEKRRKALKKKGRL